MLTVLEASLGAGRRALIIEAEDATRRTLQIFLQGWNFTVRSFGAATPALADGYADTAHVLIVAQRLPGADGATILLSLRQRGWQGRAVLVAELPTSDLVAEARRTGFAAVLGTPVGRLDLLDALVK